MFSFPTSFIITSLKEKSSNLKGAREKGKKEKFLFSNSFPVTFLSFDSFLLFRLIFYSVTLHGTDLTSIKTDKKAYCYRMMWKKVANRCKIRFVYVSF